MPDPALVEARMWWLTASLALAEPPGGGDELPDPTSWVSVPDGRGGSVPALRLEGVSGRWVEVTVRASIDSLSHSWTLRPRLAYEDVLVLPLDIPAAARLHPAAGDYVTDLVAVVDLDGWRWTRKGFLAWPAGAGGRPVVWTAEQMRQQAPQGVLSPALRSAVLGPDDRLMPDLSGVAAQEPARVSPALSEVEP